MANQSKSVGAALKIAGADNNISKKEIKQIINSTGASAAKVVAKLDSINSKSNSAPIGLGAGAANAYSKGKLGNSGDLFRSAMLGSVLGGAANSSKGPIASALNSMSSIGKSSYSSVPKGQQVFGFYNNAPQLQIKPSLSNKAAATAVASPTGLPRPTWDGSVSDTNGPGPWAPKPVDTTYNGDNTTTAGGGTTTGTSAPGNTILNIDSSSAIAGQNAALDQSASSFRRNKSKAKMAGLTTKGASQFKISGQNSSSSGVNTGI